MGLCSGAYAAFQSAAQFADPSLVESVIINPLTFYWQEGMTMESAECLKFKDYHDNMASARQPGKWLKLLTGRSKLGIGGAIRMLIERWKLWRQKRKGESETMAAILPVFPSPPLPSHPQKDDLALDLARIAKNGRPITFFFVRSDPGYDMLTFSASARRKRCARPGKCAFFS